MSPATCVWNPLPVPFVPVRGRTERLPMPRTGIVIEIGELALSVNGRTRQLHIGPAE